MKNLFVLAFVAASFALVSCGSSETASTVVDSVAAVVVDTTPVVVPVDSIASAVVDSVKAEIKK